MFCFCPCVDGWIEISNIVFLSLCRRMDAEFVEDENFPDGSRVVPERPITKRWVMKNTGLCSWDSNTKVHINIIN